MLQSNQITIKFRHGGSTTFELGLTQSIFLTFKDYDYKMQLTSREGCFFLMVLCRYEDMRRKGGNMTNVFRGVKHVYCERFFFNGIVPL